MKIWTTYWYPKGVESDSLRSFYIQHFHTFFKNKPEVITCRESWKTFPYKEFYTPHFLLDDYVDYPQHQWPLVKIMGILNIPEDTLHLDYDIFWKYDPEQLDLSHYDVVYQNSDPHFNEYWNFNKKFSKDWKGYCAGFIWIKGDVKEDIKEQLKPWLADDLGYWYWMCVEQQVIPNLVGLKFSTLHEIEKPKAPDEINMKVPGLPWNWNQTIRRWKIGEWQRDINFYHFMAGFGKRPGFREGITKIFNL